ncbi:MAG TPA: hypothetical protein VFK44_04810 [Bacillales bacterium]|nr:hypothetical protein [Bacillales bacterium]
MIGVVVGYKIAGIDLKDVYNDAPEEVFQSHPHNPAKDIPEEKQQQGEKKTSGVKKLPGFIPLNEALGKIPDKLKDKMKMPTKLPFQVNHVMGQVTVLSGIPKKLNGSNKEDYIHQERITLKDGTTAEFIDNGSFQMIEWAYKENDLFLKISKINFTYIQSPAIAGGSFHSPLFPITNFIIVFNSEL